MKKTLLYSLFALLFATAHAQQVNLQIEGFAPAEMKMLYLTDLLQQQPVDSVIPVNGRFQFSRTTEPNQFFCVGMEGLSFIIISDGTPVSINFNKGTLTGSPLNEKLHTYDLRTSALDMAMQYAFMAQDKVKLDSLRRAWHSVMREAVEDNPDNVIPAYYINELVFACDYEEIKEMLSPDKAYYDHPLTRPALTMLHDHELKMPGKPFIDMEMSDSFGRQRKLSEWCGQGKYVLLHFWDSQYEPCLRDMRRVSYCYREFHNKGLEFVGISLDTNKQQWLQAINANHMSWTQLSDLKGQQSIAVETWGIHNLPSNVLIAPDGKIVASNLFNGDLEDQLEDIFGE